MPDSAATRLAKIERLKPQPQGSLNRPVQPTDEPLQRVIVIRHGIGVYDERWFRYRFGLLRAIAAPSLKAQTNRNFHILLQVDELIDDSYLEKVCRLFDWSDRFYVQKLQFHADRRGALNAFCRQVSGIGTRHVLTTRFDDDDGMTNGALASIEDAALKVIEKGGKSAAIFLHDGLYFLAASNRGKKITDEGRSVAASVLFPRGDPQNIYLGPHRSLSDTLNAGGTPTILIGGQDASFLHTIHKMSNMDFRARLRRARFSGAFFTPSVTDLRSFGIDAAALAGWRLTEADYPGLGRRKTTDAIKEIDSEISVKRDEAALAGTQTYDAELRALMKKKIELGSTIVDTLEDRR